MNNNETLDRKRLSVEMPVNLFTDLRVRAAYKNCTITKWVIRAIIEQMKKEDKFNE